MSEDRTQDILTALELLDPQEDSHWTDLGLPAMAVICELANMPGLTRAQLTAAAPAFTRKNLVLPEIEKVVEAQPEAAPAVASTELDAEIAACETKIAEANAIINAKGTELRALEREHARLVNLRAESFPAPAQAVVYKQYLAAHQADRAAQAPKVDPQAHLNPIDRIMGVRGKRPEAFIRHPVGA